MQRGVSRCNVARGLFWGVSVDLVRASGEVRELFIAYIFNQGSWGELVRKDAWDGDVAPFYEEFL